MMKRPPQNGFTLVELITVLAIVGVFIAFFYTLLFLNWQACQQFLAQADFGQDMDTTIDQIANDGRYAQEIQVTSDADTKKATFYGPDNNILGIYTMSSNGDMIITRDGNAQIVSDKLDFTDSNFATVGTDNEAIDVNMTMRDEVLGQPISMNSETEIYPRN